jgi:SAM-dependent methyltransferase
MLPHRTIYQQAALYDLAFSYRDYAVESQWLRDAYALRRARAPRSFLELAAGPAGHALEMLAAGLDVTALDLSPEMAAYGRSKAAARGLALPYTEANMVEFQVPQRFDMVACMTCSASYLLTDAAVLSNFASVRTALADGGLYVLELTHPSELTGTKKSQTKWKMRDDAGEVEVDWNGDPGAAVDGIWSDEVSLEYRPFDGSPPISVKEQARQRGFTHGQIIAFAEQSGLVVEAALGGFDEALALASPNATRMILMLSASKAPLP